MEIQYFDSGELTQQDGWKTQGGRMTKNVAQDCAFPILRDIFSSCWVSSLLLEREKGKQLHRPIKLIAKSFHAL